MAAHSGKHGGEREPDRHGEASGADAPSVSVTGELKARIARARGATGTRQMPQPGAYSTGSSGWGRAARLGSEFIAAILVGAALGYGLDLWLGSGPWLMLVFLMVGFAAGILNVVRAAADMNAANPAPEGADLSGPDEDDDS